MVSVDKKKRLRLSFLGEPSFIKNTRIDSQIRIKFHQLRALGYTVVKMIAAWQAFKREAKVDFGRARKKGSSLLLFSFTRCHASKFLFPSLSNAYRGGYAVDYPNIIWFLQGSFRRWFFIIRHLILQLCIFLGAKWETLMSVPAGRPGRRDVGLLKIPGGGLPSMAYKGSLCPKGVPLLGFR